jgi:hypothetical protein
MQCPSCTPNPACPSVRVPSLHPPVVLVHAWLSVAVCVEQRCCVC